MNVAQRSLVLARLCARPQFIYCARQSSGEPSSKFQAMKAKQARFQCDDGLPVFLKGGFMDKALYQTTIILILIGSGMMGKLFWDLAVPKK